MVCIYCGHETQVINSRLQKRTNQVWRRRKCVSCQATFTTHEMAAYEGSWRVKDGSGSLFPFNKNKLFLSIYKSLGHRTLALEDATALTDTVMAKLLANAQDGLLEASDITTAAKTVLKHFDTAAAVHYTAFHS
jgi:transcriptional repressor NrdR